VFGGRFSSSIGVVGIDFGSHCIKMLQVREHSGKLQVVGASRVETPLAPVTATPTTRKIDAAAIHAIAPMPSTNQTGDGDNAAGEQLANQIRAAFAAGGFTGRRCVVSLAREDVCVQSIRVPKMPDDELRQTAAWEASQRFGFDRGAMEVDFIRTGAALQSGENREEIILIAASHAAIHARLEPLLAAGLRPIAIDTSFCALARAFSRKARRESDQQFVRAVVEIGWSGSTVLILRGDQVAFCKPIAIGGRLFNKAVADHLQMEESAAGDLRAARIRAVLNGDNADSAGGSITDPATDRAVYEAVRPLMGALIKEVMLCLRYYGVTFRGHPPEQIILTGGDGLEPRLSELMAHTCKVPVAFDDATNTLGGLIGQIQTCLNRTPGPSATWAVAMGLSLRGLGGKRAAAPNAAASGQTAVRRGAA